jgi:uncharacterized membrane protein
MYEVLLILHFLGLALGVGTSFALFTLGLATKELNPDERAKFMLRASALSKNGSIGLALLIASGIGFLSVRGVGAVMQWGGGAFHTKLLLVAVLIGLVGYMQVQLKKAKRAGGGPALAKLPALSRAGLAVGVAIVILAVVAFK